MKREIIMWGQPPRPSSKRSEPHLHRRQKGTVPSIHIRVCLQAYRKLRKDAPSGAAIPHPPQTKNRRPHPLRWKRRFPHSLTMTRA